MELTRSLIETKAAEYREQEPLYSVEQEQIETLPTALERGAYGRRDCAWIVRWYYRRTLGVAPDDERRTAEAHFERNEFETVRDVVDDVLEQLAEGSDDVAAAVGRLTALEGVGVEVASAFCFFLDPDRYVVVGEREWTVLREAGELDAPYPEPEPSIDAYETYLERCRDVCDRYECDIWTLYRALWRCWKEQFGEA
ncbi:hypothetical protein [Halopiger xanaduensis]|uniref:Uncharacterized protein n=1 Tax=Halopiger xanaduensis (strain DSM 18323 / JCM 14033 / SH-6) TaxID=797210 RepID=F8D737_HALXS|nr:hypothetical protein [Halopiger xanaduensis]AEH35473.1 hypothetical protein Halxa_0834 [Halopiger xanaduensis SH-6]